MVKVAGGTFSNRPWNINVLVFMFNDSFSKEFFSLPLQARLGLGFLAVMRIEKFNGGFFQRGLESGTVIFLDRRSSGMKWKDPCKKRLPPGKRLLFR